MNWISSLISPGAVRHIYEEPPEDEERAPKRMRNEIKTESSPSPVLSSAPVPSASVPALSVIPPSSVHSPKEMFAVMPPASSHTTVVPVKASNFMSGTSVAFLPAFNQRCAQQHLRVEYTAENLGLAHAPLWVVRCVGESCSYWYSFLFPSLVGVSRHFSRTYL